MDPQGRIELLHCCWAKRAHRQTQALYVNRTHLFRLRFGINIEHGFTRKDQHLKIVNGRNI